MLGDGGNGGSSNDLALFSGIEYEGLVNSGISTHRYKRSWERLPSEVAVTLPEFIMPMLLQLDTLMADLLPAPQRTDSVRGESDWPGIVGIIRRLGLLGVISGHTRGGLKDMDRMLQETGGHTRGS